MHGIRQKNSQALEMLGENAAGTVAAQRSDGDFAIPLVWAHDFGATDFAGGACIGHLPPLIAQPRVILWAQPRARALIT